MHTPSVPLIHTHPCDCTPRPPLCPLYIHIPVTVHRVHPSVFLIHTHPCDCTPCPPLSVPYTYTPLWMYTASTPQCPLYIHTPVTIHHTSVHILSYCRDLAQCDLHPTCAPLTLLFGVAGDWGGLLWRVRANGAAGGDSGGAGGGCLEAGDPHHRIVPAAAGQSLPVPWGARGHNV